MKRKIKFSKHFIVISAIFLAACSSSSTPKPSLTMHSVCLYTQPDTNQNSALAVDLVIVYGSELMAIFNQMSAKTYFAASKQLLLDNPTLLDIWHWEFIPGQRVIGFQPPQDKGDAYGAYIFANYHTPGDHRLRVGPDGIVNILFMKDGLKNLSQGANDLHMGTTMTNPPCWGNSLDANLKQGPAVTPGLAQGIIPPCNKQPVSQPCQAPCKQATPQLIQTPCKTVGNPTGKGPLPIVAQPLPPLKKRSSYKPVPCNSKRNKVN